MAISNPSTRLRIARTMPHWVMVSPDTYFFLNKKYARPWKIEPYFVSLMQQQQTGRPSLGGSGLRRPPTPPKLPPPSLTGNCDPDYEVIEFPSRSQMAQILPSSVTTLLTSSAINSSDKEIVKGQQKCALCGTPNLFVRCEMCNACYCETCDDINHKHPKRCGHARRRIFQQHQQSRNASETNKTCCRTRPPLPPKSETQANPPPVPPPRRNRRNAQVGCALAWISTTFKLSEKRGCWTLFELH